MLYNENGHPVESAKQIHSISQPEQEKIEAFLQGCVYTWCNIHEKPPKFCAADFVGGTNKEWIGTPPYTLFSSRFDQYQREYPQESLGWILKNVLINDKRSFTTHEGFHSAYYTWDGKTDNDTLE